MRECTVPRALLTSVLAVLAIGAATVPAPAQSASSRNGAAWYRRAFERLERITDADWEVLDTYWNNPGGPPPPGYRAVMAKAAPVLDLARRGSLKDYADYDLDFSQGFELLLPHLGPLRSISKLMRFDVMMRIHDGDAAGAADRVASLYRMSEHVGHDGTLISSLVGMAVFDLTEQSAQMGFDRELFGAAESEALLRAVQRLDGTDPFNVVECVVGEQSLAVDWLASKFSDPEARAAELADVEWLEIPPQYEQQFLEMTDEQFAEDLAQYDRMMDQVVEAFHLEDPEAARAVLERVEQEVKAGEHGVLAASFSPSLLKVFDRMMVMNEKIRARLDELEGLVTGAIRPDEKANAALYYARAIEMIREIEPARFEAICIWEADHRQAPEEAVRTALEAAGEIVDVLREASEKQRCDFEILHERFRLELCPDYIAGMRDAFRLLHADAARLIEAGEDEAIADRLQIASRAVAHLGGDDPILSARVAQRAFGRTCELAEEALEIGLFGPEDRSALLKAARRIARKDPFGFIGSVMETRKRIRGSIYQRLSPRTHDQELHALTRAVVQGWNGDELVYYLAVHEALEQAGREAAAKAAPGGDDPLEPDAGPEGASPHSPDPLSRLTGIISADALAAARREAQLVAPALARGEIDIIGDRSVPEIAAVAEHMSRARGDLRQGLAMLRRAAQVPPEDADAGVAGDERSEPPG